MSTADRYFALGVESTYGTAVTPTLFIPAASADIAEPPPAVIDFGGIRYGEFGSNEQDIAFGPRANGTVSFEAALLQTGFETILSHIFGSVATTSTTPTRQSVLTIGSTNGKFMTAQIIKPYHDGTSSVIQTAKGCKFTQASLSLDKGTGVIRLSATMDARNVVSDVTATTASYSTTSRPFIWHKTSTATVGGTAVSCSGWTLDITRPLDTDTTSLGSTGLKTEPPNSGQTTISFTLNDVVFDSTTHYERLVSTASSDRIKAIVLTTTSDTNTSQLLTLSATKCIYTGGVPGGLTRDNFKLPQNLTFTVVYPTGGGTPLTATMVHV